MSDQPETMDNFKDLLAQYHYDIGFLAQVIALQALKPARTREEVAALFDAVGKSDPRYLRSVVRAVPAAIRDAPDDDE